MLVLLSKSRFKQCFAGYRTSLGFTKNVLEEVTRRTSDMNPFKKHSCLLNDVLKLSEQLCVKQSGHTEGFVVLGEYPSTMVKSVSSNHGMVILFLPFFGKWSQVIGTFCTSGNMRGDMLAQVFHGGHNFCGVKRSFCGFRNLRWIYVE